MALASGGRRDRTEHPKQLCQGDAAKAGADCRGANKIYTSNDLASVIHEETPPFPCIDQPHAEHRTGTMSATHDSNGEWETDHFDKVGY